MQNNNESKKSPNNVFLLGCFAILGVFAISFLFGVYSVYTEYRKVIDYIQDKPEIIQYSENLPIKSAQSKINLLINNKSTKLTISANEINALIVHNADFAEIKNKMKVFIQDNIVKVQFSLPMKKFTGKDKSYLNATAKLKIKIDKGELNIQLDGLEKQGIPLDLVIENLWNDLNLLDNIKNTTIREKLRNLKLFKIENNEISIELR